MSLIGAVTFYRDSKKQFLKEHHEPYIKNKKESYSGENKLLK